ncbi:MAG: spheroidene monooxygenase [Actinobacteria bacterium]|nr:spheroidene monooxygenase [Actinomycetota bacterium]
MNPVLYVWKTSSRSLPWVLIQMAINPVQFRRFPGVTFAKSLGTGRGISFTPTDADLNQWSALLVFSDENSATNFDNSKYVKRWNRHSTEQLRVILQPISSHGLWAKSKPFGEPTPIKWDGKVAAITRARIKWWMNLQFWRAVPPVTQDLHNQPGLLAAIGIGEAPIGLQGTFSIWRDGAALRSFAYEGSAHKSAIAKTAELNWYSEELFARFGVREISGTLNGVDFTN